MDSVVYKIIQKNVYSSKQKKNFYKRSYNGKVDLVPKIFIYTDTSTWKIISSVESNSKIAQISKIKSNDSQQNIQGAIQGFSAQ